MFIVGTCNPRGEPNTYNGLYLTEGELQDIVHKKKMNGLPVKTEHGGEDVGQVVSSFLNDNRELQCVIELNKQSIAGSLAQGFVWDNVARDLSLGYVVDVKQSGQKLQAAGKEIMEVSLVRKGARSNCHITMCQTDNNLFIKQQHMPKKQTCFEPYFSLT